MKIELTKTLTEGKMKGNLRPRSRKVEILPPPRPTPLYNFHEDFELEARRAKHLKELRQNAYY